MFHTFILRQRRIAVVLKAFHQAELSASSLQPVLDLAVEMNPDLAGKPAFQPVRPLAAVPATEA